MFYEISAYDCKDMLLHVCRVVIKNEPYLTEIDSRIGDGDHGVGMKRGFSHLYKELSANSFESINELFKFAGMELLKSMGGASGVLFGTFFIAGLKDSKTEHVLTVPLLAEMMEKALKAIKQRGKAQPGDKTMVDALEPGVESLCKSAKKNASVTESLYKAQMKAKKGMIKTADMLAKFGRAKQFGKEAIGHYDAGAVSVYLVFLAMYEWAKEKENRVT